MANLQTLALYLTAGIEVEHRLFGRGVLQGLPYVQPWDRSPNGAHADAHFTSLPPNEVCSGVHRVCNVTPVLYAPGDRVRVVSAHPNRARFTDVLTLSIPELEHMASIVDAARALGIALNLSPKDYIRKELPRGLQEGKDYCPNTGFPL